eukprot:COSAG01_NODE_424_length_17253_cov_31.601900_29_plen_78_part_00
MAVDELSTSYHPAPAYFDDAAPHLLAGSGAGCSHAATAAISEYTPRPRRPPPLQPCQSRPSFGVRPRPPRARGGAHA